MLTKLRYENIDVARKQRNEQRIYFKMPPEKSALTDSLINQNYGVRTRKETTDELLFPPISREEIQTILK